MSIPESKLQTWANPAPATTAINSHEKIREALAAWNSPIKDKIANDNVEIYLQGSYRNDTNIRGDSDVDLVVQLNTTFQHDLSALSDLQKELFHETYPNADYKWDHFRADVLTALRTTFGDKVVEGNKSLKVKGEPGRLPADVVPCLEYHKYAEFYDSPGEYVSGIAFYSLPERRRIINFPKLHYDNGVAKNGMTHTNGSFKPSVRMFKNARSYLVDNGAILKEHAPSYFVQCLLYNVPNYLFTSTRQRGYEDITKWLSSANLSSFICQNEQLPLFGNTPEQWSESDATLFIAALIDLWNDW